ncbi:MAG: hypothetical protein HUK21_01435 [Fibrobacteraceae bacterium]|nr:hypothetical protein [Fibrobacteraceae bacterium]
MKTQYKKIYTTLASLAFCALVGCASENPIEAENGKKDFDGFSNAVSKLQEGLDNVDFARCVKKYGEERCSNFNAIYGSYDCEEIANPNYDDQGNYTYVPPEGDKEEVEYITANKSFFIVVKNFKALSNEISDTVNFEIEYLSDDVVVNKKRSAFLYPDKDGKWTAKTSEVTIPRGINEIRICPTALESSSDEANRIKGKCHEIEKIGTLEESKPVEYSDKTDIFEITWEWYFY